MKNINLPGLFNHLNSWYLPINLVIHCKNGIYIVTTEYLNDV